jgi:hypothetical protein
MALLPPSSKRVQWNTSDDLNERIEKETIYNAVRFAGKNYAAITARMKELDREWDTERVLETLAAILMLVSIICGFRIHPAWFYLCGIIAFCLLQHALQGWCPPLPLIRKLGVRTAAEINGEKMALKALRGDFNRRFR